MVEDRTQVNLPDDCIEILAFYSKKLAPKGMSNLRQPDTIRRMAAELGYYEDNPKK
jgi:hypothetical protein